MTNLLKPFACVTIQREIETTPARSGIPVRDHLYFAVDNGNRPVFVKSTAHLHPTQLIPMDDLTATFDCAAGTSTTYRHNVAGTAAQNPLDAGRSAVFPARVFA